MKKKISKPSEFGEYKDFYGEVNIEFEDDLNSLKELCNDLKIDLNKYEPIAVRLYATEYSPKTPTLFIYAIDKEIKESYENLNQKIPVVEFTFDKFPSLFKYLRGYNILLREYDVDLSKFEINSPQLRHRPTLHRQKCGAWCIWKLRCFLLHLLHPDRKVLIIRTFAYAGNVGCHFRTEKMKK